VPPSVTRLSKELGIDVQGAVKVAYDLGRHMAESESAYRLKRIAGVELSQRELELEAENEALRGDAQKLLKINRHLWRLIMEDHQFITGGGLQRAISNARKAGDKCQVETLKRMLAVLEQGGPRRWKRKRGPKLKKAKGKK